MQTSPDAPVPVRTVAHAIGQWVSRLGRVWVEGQVTEVVRRPGAGTVFLTLRDPVAEVSLRATCSRAVVDDVVPPLTDGARVVVHGKPTFWLARGSLSLAIDDIRPLGLGLLLARLEQLRAVLTAEGLFAAERKRRLPFLPGTVGLVCGRGSAAERDVLSTTRRRWPAVRFQVENVAVQGPYAVNEVTDALGRLDRDPTVEVIVVARGGGSVEDLLPFSDETLLRAVASCRTPVVSAIGHEPDAPLLDLVADVRASTPTDAAKRLVPDVAEETVRLHALRERCRQVVRHRLATEQAGLASLRSRPVLADPAGALAARQGDVTALRDRARRCLAGRLERAADDVRHAQARVTGLSPAATLNRGYAVVQRADGTVLRSAGDTAVGAALSVRLDRGRLEVEVSEAVEG
jgi:exodeoxyribonuclease VII large subunit